MSGIATAIGGTAVLGYMGSQNAADSASDSAAANIEFQKWLYGETEQNMQPYTSAGAAGMDAYMQALGLGGSTWDEEQAAIKANQMNVVSDFRNLIGGNTAPEAFVEAGWYIGGEGKSINDMTDEEILQGLMQTDQSQYQSFKSDLMALDTEYLFSSSQVLG